MKRYFFFGLCLFLTACAGKPVSYLPTGTTPIVNVEANLAERVGIKAESEMLSVANVTEQAVNVVYKLFWYDIDGVTQPSAQGWQTIWLEPHQSSLLPLNKPTAESANYRIYLRGSR